MSTAWIVVIVCLWLVVVGLALVVAGVLRKVAAALEFQAGAGAGAPALRGGPVAGVRLPEIKVAQASGEAVELSELSGPFVLAILTSHCAPCLAVAEWLRSNPHRLSGGGRLVVLTDAKGRGVIDLDSRVTVLADQEHVALEALDVPGTPFVVVIDAEGRVASSSLLSGPEHLVSLLGAPDSALRNELRIETVG